jgi:ribonucleoside-diphosphate reductase alpha chain
MATLTDNALKVLEARYLLRDARGQIVESPEDLFRRVAHAVADAESHFGDKAAAKHWDEAFYAALGELEFLPNSPTLMNAGTPCGQLSACFVLPVGDSMEEIFDALKLMALIQQTGGGTGFSFSRLRPQGDPVTSAGGTASGPVSFMKVFDAATENVRHGGKRRGANMGVLRVDHPDIRQFIEAKLDGRSLCNFNLSVAASDDFFEAAAADRPFALRNPRTAQTTGTVSAAQLLAEIAETAWKTGDPGMIFVDAIQRGNPTPALGAIESTNPCGEVPLLPYEACNLGSINLSRMLRATAGGPAIDWEKLAQTTRLGVRFLDNVVEVNRWPSPQIAQASLGNRKVGLGVMGFADLLIQLGVSYASDGAVSLAREIMQAISDHAWVASQQLAQERGVFPNWSRSVFASRNRPVRNATCTSIAPTGTISILAGTSASIEPLFGLAYRRHVLDGQTLIEMNPLFARSINEQQLDSQRLQEELARHGSLDALGGIPPAMKSLFKTALEINPEQHLRIQAAFQEHVDNAVSKTINMPQSCTAEEIREIYVHAWQYNLKGVTVYRYGSKDQQTLELGVEQHPEEFEHFARCDPHACKL